MLADFRGDTDKQIAYLNLVERYNELNQQADRFKADLPRMVSICKKSYAIDLELIRLSPSKLLRNHWRLNAIEDLIIVLAESLTTQNPEKFAETVALIQTQFNAIQKPIDSFSKEKFQQMQTAFDRIATKNGKPLKYDDSETATFNPILVWKNIAYGNKGQEYFNHQSLDAIYDTTQILHEWSARGIAKSDRFKKTISHLASMRQKIAMETKTEDAELFGKLRTPPNPDIESESNLSEIFGSNAIHPMITPMGTKYEMCLYKIKEQHKPCLIQYRKNGQTHFEERYGDYIFTTEILDYTELEPLQKRIQQGQILPGDQLMTNLLMQYRNNIKGRANGYIMSTLHIEKDGIRHPVTTHMTSFRIDSLKPGVAAHKLVSKRGLDDYDLNSGGLLIHRGDITTTAYFNEILSEKFQQALDWDGADQQALNRLVGEIHFILAHAMFYHRGSAAVSEWLVKTIYKYHGFRLEKLKPGVMLDLEALPRANIESYADRFAGFWSEKLNQRITPIPCEPLALSDSDNTCPYDPAALFDMPELEELPPQKSSASRLSSPFGDMAQALVKYKQHISAKAQEKYQALAAQFTSGTTLHCEPSIYRYNDESIPVLNCQGEDFHTLVFPSSNNCETFTNSDNYNINSCRPIEFHGLPSIACDGEHTTMVYTPTRQARPFETLGANIMLGQVLFHIAKSVVKALYPASEPQPEPEPVKKADSSSAQIQIDKLSDVLSLTKASLKSMENKWATWCLEDSQAQLEALEALLKKDQLSEEELKETSLDICHLSTELIEESLIKGKQQAPSRLVAQDSPICTPIDITRLNHTRAEELESLNRLRLR